MMPIPIPFELLGLIFAAGGFYIFVRSALKQVAEANRRASANHYRSAIILLATCPVEKREQIASWLLQSVMGD